ncbi:MAG: 2OG-Fe(II) oxygenase [Sphingobacteriales bacterium]|nr:MAG: 2OG-Fe(II) oxygenase [Sphingobacteriales bacterium]
MSIPFDSLIQSYIDQQVGIATDFLPSALADGLAANIRRLHASDTLQSAGTGNNAEALQDKNIRGDSIHWLDASHHDAMEDQFFLHMDAFISYLNESCYAGITGYEFHYTLYGKGSFYTRHVDQFRNDRKRKFSMIIYLNKDWKEGDGGELCIYSKGSTRRIAPENGTSVFFASNETEHEVLVTNQPRLSITGWLLGAG